MKLIVRSHDTRPGAHGDLESCESAHRGEGSRGQVVVLFAGAMVVLIGMMAIVIDVSWLWSNSLRVQRAADAAALAGVVYLPGQPSSAFAAARTESKKNGFEDIGVASGVVVTPTVDPANNRALRVKVKAPVGTFFMRIFGMQAWDVTKSSKAEYVLPVPMGSPDNYYGVGYYVKPVTTTTTETTYPKTSGDSGWLAAGAPVTGGSWTTPANATILDTGAGGNDNAYATEDTDNQRQAWDTFRLLNTTGAVPANPKPRIPVLTAAQTIAIDAIQVRLTDVGLAGSGARTDCRIGVELNWNAGGSSDWSDQILSAAITDQEQPTHRLT